MPGTRLSELRLDLSASFFAPHPGIARSAGMRVRNGAEILRTLRHNEMIRLMPGLFLSEPVLRAMLPFPADEERWIRSCYRQGTRQPLVTRIGYDVPNARAASGHQT